MLHLARAGRRGRRRVGLAELDGGDRAPVVLLGARDLHRARHRRARARRPASGRRGLPSSRPLAVVGQGGVRRRSARRRRRRRSGTSARPRPRPLSDGRNHAQLSMVRITRLSSAPRNFSNASRAGLVGARPEAPVVVVASSSGRAARRRRTSAAVCCSAQSTVRWRCSAGPRRRASSTRQAPSSGWRRPASARRLRLQRCRAAGEHDRRRAAAERRECARRARRLLGRAEQRSSVGSGADGLSRRAAPRWYRRARTPPRCPRSVTSPSTSSTSYACLQPSAPAIDEHRADRAGGVVAAVHVEPERPPRRRALGLPRRCRRRTARRRPGGRSSRRSASARRSCSRSSRWCRAGSRRRPAGRRWSASPRAKARASARPPRRPRSRRRARRRRTASVRACSDRVGEWWTTSSGAHGSSVCAE